MPILNKLSGAFPAALIYITVGTLIVIWTLVALVFNPPESNTGTFWVVGFLVTGLALLVIGLLLGPIGRAARNAELPPPEVTAAALQAEQNAAARAPMLAPVNPAAPGLASPAPVLGAAPVVPAAPFQRT